MSSNYSTTGRCDFHQRSTCHGAPAVPININRRLLPPPVRKKHKSGTRRLLEEMALFPLFIVVVGMASFLGGGVPVADAWGKEGHYMVCKIAEKYLSEAAVSAVSDLLPSDAEGELANVCSWADHMRFRYHWASPLHYINTPEVCNYKYSRDCHNSHGEPNMCVAGAINNYTHQLQAYGQSSSEYDLTEALMFLAHFVGDIHQPLHVGYEDDEGGNTISVHWYRRKANLHHVWDVSIIETAMRDFYDDDMMTMIDAIQANITDGWADEVPKWESCDGQSLTCPDIYASESITLACNYAYKDVEQDSTLEDDYFFSRLPVVKKRIAQAGMRLAALLNRLFDKSASETNSNVQEA